MAVNTQVISRNNLALRAHTMRSYSDVFYAPDQTKAMAADVYRNIVQNNVNWIRSYEVIEELVVRDYNQASKKVARGQAYAALCDFGFLEHAEKQTVGVNSSRRLMDGMYCLTIEVPDYITDWEKNTNGADLDTLAFTVYGDGWLRFGCYAAVFMSDDEHPPLYSELIKKMTTPGAEKMGIDCWAGYLGEWGPADERSTRYLRTNVICDSESQGGPISQRTGINQPLLFQLHAWGINEYDEEQNRYKIKPYIHILLFLDEKQYTQERNYYLEGSACISILSLELRTTADVAREPKILDVCSLGNTSQTADPASAVDLPGSVFSLVNVFKSTDLQAAAMSKSYAQTCAWNSIQGAIARINTPNAVYGFRQYPPITSQGFDFYTVAVGGEECIRIGCIDENAMAFSNDTPLPSIYSFVMGYPVSVGFGSNVFDRMIFTNGVRVFSGCVLVKVVVYMALRSLDNTVSGSNYGFSTMIDQSKFNSMAFFDGTATELVLSGDEKDSKLSLTRLYMSYHTEILAGHELVFDEVAKFNSSGLLLIGVEPVDFTKKGAMKDGDWIAYENPVYKSQYMQLVEWPISHSVKIVEIE